MCDVHLVETYMDYGACNFCCVCSDCEVEIRLGESMVTVHGHLDDGTEGTFVFHYHTECHESLDELYDADGCFSYGTPAHVE